jgi:hypothetical protein
MPERFHDKAPSSKNRAPVLEMSVLGSDPDVPVSELLSELLKRKMLYELDPDVPVSELLFELPIQKMLYELCLGRSGRSGRS